MLAADDKQLGAGEHAGKEVIPGGALAAEFLRRIDRRIDHTGETRLRLPQRAVETMLSSNPRLVLAVLNKVDVGRNKYYYSRYYGHQYKNYYAESPAA